MIAATRAVSAVSSEARYVARAAWRSAGVVAVDRASKYAARAVDLAARYVALMAFSPSTYAFHCAWKAFHAEIEALFEVDVGAAVVVVEVVVVVSPYAAIAGTLTPESGHCRECCQCTKFLDTHECSLQEQPQST